MTHSTIDDLVEHIVVRYRNESSKNTVAAKAIQRWCIEEAEREAPELTPELSGEIGLKNIQRALGRIPALIRPNGSELLLWIVQRGREPQVSREIPPLRRSQHRGCLLRAPAARHYAVDLSHTFLLRTFYLGAVTVS